MLYFAYGSNLWPARLIERVPGARIEARACLSGWRLHFHKRSDVDGSGKAGVSESADAEVWGALYRLPPEEVAALDRAEGLGVGYDRRAVDVGVEVEVEVEEVEEVEIVRAFTYVARSEVIDRRLRPFAWYHRFVVRGAEHHDLPARYVDTLRAVAADPDPDEVRRRVAAEILRRTSAPPAGSGAGGR